MMNMPEIVTAHLGHLIGGGSAGAGGVAVFSLLFRDAIKEWWQERKEERRATRAARTAEAGKGDAVGVTLVAVLREDLKERREHDNRIVAVLEGVKEILVRLETKQLAQGSQLDLVHQRVISIQGDVARIQ